MVTLAEGNRFCTAMAILEKGEGKQCREIVPEKYAKLKLRNSHMGSGVSYFQKIGAVFICRQLYRQQVDIHVFFCAVKLFGGSAKRAYASSFKFWLASSAMFGRIFLIVP